MNPNIVSVSGKQAREFREFCQRNHFSPAQVVMILASHAKESGCSLIDFWTTFADIVKQVWETDWEAPS